MAFVVDSSGSIGRKNWVRMKQFLSDIVQLFHVGPDGTRVAMVMYSTSAKVVFKFNTLRGSKLTAAEYEKLIMRMNWMRGFTFIDKGIQLANKEVFTTAAGMRGKDIPKVSSWLFKVMIHFKIVCIKPFIVQLLSTKKILNRSNW